MALNLQRNGLWHGHRRVEKPILFRENWLQRTVRRWSCRAVRVLSAGPAGHRIFMLCPSPTQAPASLAPIQLATSLSAPGRDRRVAHMVVPEPSTIVLALTAAFVLVLVS